MHIPSSLRLRYADVASTLAMVLALGGTAYASGTVGTADIQNGAVTTPKLAAEAVTTAKLAPASVTNAQLASSAVKSGNIVNGSVTLADLKGINMTGNISFTFNAHTCGKLTFGVSGASSGQAALLTWTGTPPAHLMVGPLQVVSSTQIIGYGCNVGGTTISASSLGVRIVTFG